ncbi:MAG TPA: hypothetical protein VNO26_06545 [Candidatus Limnocylindria bacterium]|nr:hypothetical protein [Candidatus Limnocylindria bacterium]
MSHRSGGFVSSGFVSLAVAFALAYVVPCARPALAQQAVTDPESYIVLGEQRLSVSSLTVRTGNVGVSVGNLISRSVLTADNSMLVGENVKVAATSICAGVVAGQAVGTSESCPVAVGQSVPPFPALREACDFPATLPACAATPPLILEAGQEVTLDPGAYGEVRITGGSPGFATLRLNGTYTFCNLRALAKSRILFSGPSTVHVNGRFILRNAFFGPDPSIPLAERVDPRQIKVFVSGPVGLSRTAQLKANVCAPDTAIRGTAVSVTGRLIGKRVRLRRCVLGLTDLPATCGNDIREGDEECDPGPTGGTFVGGSCGFCTVACTCDPKGGTTTTTTSSTTSTSTSSSSTTSSSSSTVTSVTNTSVTTSTTTTTFQPGVCGNQVREGDEECDGDDFGDATCPGSTSGAFLACTEACTIDFSECPPSSLELCGNCFDDDENGLTDYEDPACCAATQRYPMVLKKGAISRNARKQQTKLKLRSVLAMSGLADADPTKADVFVQLRDPAGQSILCARIPASSFKAKKNGKRFKFRDRDGRLPSAGGIRKLIIARGKDGSLTLRAKGKSVPFAVPAAGAIEITTAFAPPDGEARCSAARRPFRTGKKGKLVFP